MGLSLLFIYFFIAACVFTVEGLACWRTGWVEGLKKSGWISFLSTSASVRNQCTVSLDNLRFLYYQLIITYTLQAPPHTHTLFCLFLLSIGVSSTILCTAKWPTHFFLKVFHSRAHTPPHTTNPRKDRGALNTPKLILVPLIRIKMRSLARFYLFIYFYLFWFFGVFYFIFFLPNPLQVRKKRPKVGTVGYFSYPWWAKQSLFGHPFFHSLPFSSLNGCNGMVTS